MMDSLRTAANSLVLKIIFVIIIVSFILTGVSGYLIGGSNNYAAKVNGQEISRAQFENAFNNERNRMQQQLGDRYSELAANEGYMKSLRQQVLNRLIDEALLDQYSRELKLGISDEQVKQAIFATPAFQVDGKFDNNRYNAIVNQMGMTADQYAQALRNQLTTQQLINGVAGTDFMLKGETDELAALVSQQRVVREAVIDVNALAKEKSTDIISARNGGDMGWLEESATVPELKNAGLKEKGQISGVIKSSVGFLVARLDDIQPAKVKPLSEVRDDIAAKVKQEKALDAYYALQQKVSDAASNDNESLAGAEQVAGVKAVETGWFSRDTLPEELNFKPVADAIFNGGLVGENGTPGPNSDIITVDGDRAFVVRVSEHKPEAVKPLAEVKEQVTALVKHNKAEQQAKLDAEKLLVELKAGKGAEAMKAAGLSFGEPKTLSRTSQDPVSQAAFALSLPTKDKPVYGVANDMQGNVVLLAFDEVKAGAMPEAQKKAMVQGITQNNAQIVFEALMSNLRKEAKIKIGDALEQQ
ncbi:TPA: peptidylprolyl isomerase [Salmonella enterica subsp. enterica serovar Infantis]